MTCYAGPTSPFDVYISNNFVTCYYIYADLTSPFDVYIPNKFVTYSLIYVFDLYWHISFTFSFLYSDDSDVGLGKASDMALAPKKKLSWSVDEETVMWKHLQVIVFIHLYLYYIYQLILLQFICPLSFLYENDYISQKIATFFPFLPAGKHREPGCGASEAGCCQAGPDVRSCSHHRPR